MQRVLGPTKGPLLPTIATAALAARSAAALSSSIAAAICQSWVQV
jgi:hypothetical protein